MQPSCVTSKVVNAAPATTALSLEPVSPPSAAQPIAPPTTRNASPSPDHIHPTRLSIHALLWLRDGLSRPPPSETDHSLHVEVVGIGAHRFKQREGRKCAF